MYHKLYQVTDFKIIKSYLLEVNFNDGTQQIIDFEPVLFGEIWGPLRDETFFNQVTIDPVAKTLVWPNGADFDPETLRNWPDYADALANRAKEWDRHPLT
jgi:hypothetical protein